MCHRDQGGADQQRAKESVHVAETRDELQEKSVEAQFNACKRYKNATKLVWQARWAWV